LSSERSNFQHSRIHKSWPGPRVNLPASWARANNQEIQDFRGAHDLVGRHRKIRRKRDKGGSNGKKKVNQKGAESAARREAGRPEETARPPSPRSGDGPDVGMPVVGLSQLTVSVNVAEWVSDPDVAVTVTVEVTG
jgi:hypothetical protein